MGADVPSVGPVA